MKCIKIIILFFILFFGFEACGNTGGMDKTANESTSINDKNITEDSNIENDLSDVNINQTADEFRSNNNEEEIKNPGSFDEQPKAETDNIPNKSGTNSDDEEIGNPNSSDNPPEAETDNAPNESDSNSNKGELKNPYFLGDSFEITAYDIVPYSAYSPLGRQVKNPITLRISNVQVLEQQTYISYENGENIRLNNYYLISFDLEILQSDLSDSITFNLDYLHLYNLNTTGQQGNTVLGSHAKIPENCIYFNWQTLAPQEGMIWNFADVIQTENEKDLTHIIFSYCGEDGEFHNIYIANNAEAKTSSDTDSSKMSIEEKYEKALEYIDNEEWQLAKEMLLSLNSHYKDSKKATSYVYGMLFKNSNVYGSAIEYFGKASGYKDADNQREELLKLVNKYEGTWYYDNPKYPGKGLGYFMFIKEGKVSLAYESSIKNYGMSISYFYSLATRHNNENALDEIFLVSSLTGLFEDITDDNLKYLFVELPDGSLVVSGRSLTEIDYFSGVYDKISDEVPEN